MLLRPTTEDDLERVLACAPYGQPGSVRADLYRAGLAARHYRPEWTWVADEGGEVLARACWWGPSDADQPRALDGVDVHESMPGRATLAASLLTAGHAALRARGGHRPPRFEIPLPNGWRADPAVARSLGWRRRAAALAGLTDELERLRYEWTPEAGLPRSSGRLMFRAEPDDGTFLDAFRRVAAGSLDGAARGDAAAPGGGRQSRDDMRACLSTAGGPDWRRLAFTGDGGLAGLAMGCLNPGGPVVGYLGVLPELRGRGYIDDILAEITACHAAAGAQRIVADAGTGTSTGTGDAAMAAAFERAGYRNHGIRLVLSAPQP